MRREHGPAARRLDREQVDRDLVAVELSLLPNGVTGRAFSSCSPRVRLEIYLVVRVACATASWASVVAGCRRTS